jgi:hypothetical protein
MWEVIGWGGEYNIYGGMAEKSTAAERRQNQATAKFDAVRKSLQDSIISNKVRVVLLGCKQQSDESESSENSSSSSLFSLLPTVCVDHILDYVRAAAPTPAALDAAVAAAPVAAMAASTGLVAARAAKMTGNKKQLDDAAAPPAVVVKPLLPLDEIMKQLYTPGYKIILPITKPNLHLTAPCWRDFSRRVRSLDDGAWNVKRIAATAQEKKAYNEYRQGKVYFIHAIYTVPGTAATAPKMKRKSAAKNNKKAPPCAAAAQGNGNIGDEDNVNDSKPRAKKLKTTCTTPTTASASSLQQE